MEEFETRFEHCWNSKSEELKAIQREEFKSLYEQHQKSNVSELEVIRLRDKNWTENPRLEEEEFRRRRQILIDLQNQSNNSFPKLMKAVSQNLNIPLKCDIVEARACEVGADTVTCSMLFARIIVDVVCIVFGAIGLNSTVAERVGSRIAAESAEIIPELMTRFGRQLQSDSVLERAQAAFSLVLALCTASGASRVISIVSDSMEWYDWILMGVTITAQIVALFATDGAAVVGEVVLLISNAPQLAIDLAKSVEAGCFG